VKKAALCLILLLSVAPVALAGMEYNFKENRWEFVPDTNEEMKFKTPEDARSYRELTGKTQADRHDSGNEIKRHNQESPTEPEPIPVAKPKPMPTTKRTGPPPPYLFHPPKK